MKSQRRPPNLRGRFPNAVRGVLGSIRVEITDDLMEKHGAWGMANYSDRVITIDADVLEGKDRGWVWKIFWHEVAHFWLEDSGVGSGLSKEQKEQICDAYAAARVTEMRNG